MRLRWGPHAGRAAEQVVLRDPHYCVWWLAERPDSGLAAVFRALIVAFDERPLTSICSLCLRPARLGLANDGAVALSPACGACAARAAAVGPTRIVADYEAAVRHVGETLPRGLRVHMRRIVGELTRLKGGPVQLTETASVTFLSGAAPRDRPARADSDHPAS